ncbi:GNAT family N-acetyltransferase [Pseudonocardia sp. NPDC049635]|uniref:GNAT family N-acetyltransferase n=1 Tax=Pseudonocardia sp. NPDC049635 TaxID=3155506 RepID=UPI0033FF93B8
MGTSASTHDRVHPPLRSGVPDATWTVDVLGNLDGLARDWDDLVDRCATATPFQRHGWLSAWWRHYGPEGAQRVICVRRGGVLVAGAAVFVERRAGMRVLAPVGRGLSDITEFPVDDLHRPAALHRLAGALLALPGWQLLDLPEVREGSAAESLSRSWRHRVAVTDASVSIEVPFRSVSELLTGPGTKSLRRRVRSAEQSGITCATADDDLPTAVDVLIELHRRQWEGRNGNPEHFSPRFRGLLLDALVELARCGAARLECYRLEGEVVAAELLLVGSRSLYTYFIGFTPSLREKVDVTALTLRRSLDIVERHGLATVDLLRGDEPYKRRWRTVEVHQHRHLLCRPGSVRQTAFVAAVRSRAALRRRLIDRHPQVHAALGDAVRRWRSDGPVGLVRAGTAAVGASLTRRTSALRARCRGRTSTATTASRPAPPPG